MEESNKSILSPAGADPDLDFLSLAQLEISEPTFTPFPRLPSELRLKIWALVERKPRVMSIEQQTMHASLCPIFMSRSPAFVLFQVNHESREVALELHHKSESYKRIHTSSPIYLDMKFDILTCRTHAMFRKYFAHLSPGAPAGVDVFTQEDLRLRLKHLVVLSDDVDVHVNELREYTQLKGLQSISMRECNTGRYGHGNHILQRVFHVHQKWDILWGGKKMPLRQFLTGKEKDKLEVGDISFFQEKVAKGLAEMEQNPESTAPLPWSCAVS